MYVHIIMLVHVFGGMLLDVWGVKLEGCKFERCIKLNQTKGDMKLIGFVTKQKVI